MQDIRQELGLLNSPTLLATFSEDDNGSIRIKSAMGLIIIVTDEGQIGTKARVRTYHQAIHTFVMTFITHLAMRDFALKRFALQQLFGVRTGRLSDGCQMSDHGNRHNREGKELVYF
jgi:hypothetical protein